MTITIELMPDVADRLARKAAQDGMDMAEYMQNLAVHAAEVPDAAEMEAQIEAANRQHVPQSLKEVPPRRLPPPGKTAMQMIQGQWPGAETAEELLAQLKALG
jgi:hypothetical protein